MRAVGSALLTAALFLALPAMSSTSVAIAAEPQSMQIIGKWKVLSLEGVHDLFVGDIVEFTEEGQLLTYYNKPPAGSVDLQQSYRITGRTLSVPSGKLEVEFRVSGQRLTLTTVDGFVKVVMRRAGQVTVG